MGNVMMNESSQLIHLSSAELEINFLSKHIVLFEYYENINIHTISEKY